MNFHSSKKHKAPSGNSHEQGFALLLAVVVAGVLLSVTYLMFSINLKQVSLSTTGANSQYALYAADNGVECSLHEDNKIENAFALIDSTTDLQNNTTLTLTAPDPIPTFKCDGRDITPTLIQTDNVSVNNIVYPKSLKYSFEVDGADNGTGSPNTQCAIVTVSKYVDSKLSGSVRTEYLRTKIESRGYNTCLNLTDPNRVERGLEVYY